MKKVIIAFVIIAITTSSAFAQTAAPVQNSSTTVAVTDDRAVNSAKKLQQELGLTDDQYNKILVVNTECMKRRDAAKASGQTGREAFKPIMDYREQQYATILTADQAAKLKDIEAKEREERKASKGQSNSGE
jgi:Spy/CpxP family protein refolding chaperone